MELTAGQRRHLRGLGHGLGVLVQVGGAGVTPALLAELDGQLEHHELVKIRVRSGERAARDAMIAELTGATGAALVGQVGHTALLFRQRRDKPGIVLPAPRRAAQT